MKRLIILSLLMLAVVLPSGCDAGSPIIAPASAPPKSTYTYTYGLPEPKVICNAPEGGIHVFSDADCQSTTDKVLLNGSAVEMLESAPMCAPVGVGDRSSTPSAYYTGYMPRWYLCFSGTIPPLTTLDPWTSGCLSYLLAPAIWGVFAVVVVKKVKGQEQRYLLLMALLPVACILAYVIAFPLLFQVVRLKDRL